MKCRTKGTFHQGYAPCVRVKDCQGYKNIIISKLSTCDPLQNVIDNPILIASNGLGKSIEVKLHFIDHQNHVTALPHTYLDTQNNFPWVPNCTLGPPKARNITVLKTMFGLCENASFPWQSIMSFPRMGMYLQNQP